MSNISYRQFLLIILICVITGCTAPTPKLDSKYGEALQSGIENQKITPSNREQRSLNSSSIEQKEAYNSMINPKDSKKILQSPGPINQSSGIVGLD